MVLTRRNLLSTGLGLGVAGLGLAGRSPALAQQNTITVTTFGGIWERGVKEAFVADFEKRTGAKANVLIGSPPQWMSQIEANRANPPIHALVNTCDFAIAAGKNGLVEKMTVEKVPALAEVPAKFTEICQGWGTCLDYASVGFAYHERLKNPPKSIAELVEGTIKGTYRTSLPGVGYSGTPQFLIWSFADVFGGSVDNVDPAFQRIRQMMPNSVFWNGINDPLQHLESGEADIAIYPDGRTWAHFDSGAKWIRFLNPSEGGALSPACIQIAKNAPEVTWQYVNSVLSAAPQEVFAKILQFAMTNRNVKYDSPLKERITDWEKTRIPDFEQIALKQTSWIDRWNRELR